MIEKEEILRYSDLSTEEKQFICNGCGAKGGFLNPPEFLFHASCNHHDFYYWRGCNEEHRKVADDSFYKFMKQDVSEVVWWRKAANHTLAYAYYKAVRFFGKEAFTYSDKMKTREDLEREMKEAK